MLSRGTWARSFQEVADLSSPTYRPQSISSGSVLFSVSHWHLCCHSSSEWQLPDISTSALIQHQKCRTWNLENTVFVRHFLQKWLFHELTGYLPKTHFAADFLHIWKLGEIAAHPFVRPTTSFCLSTYPYVRGNEVISVRNFGSNRSIHGHTALAAGL